MSVLGKAWNAVARLAQEPTSNKLVGRVALANAFGLACTMIYTVATGHNISTVMPFAGGLTSGLLLVKTGIGVYQLQRDSRPLP
jgi:hypothetical protein